MPRKRKQTGRLLLNLARRLHQDVLDWLFVLKRSWLNCCKGEQENGATSGGDGKSNSNNNNNSSVKNSNKDSVTEKKSYEGSFTEMAWFCQVNREKAVAMVKKGGEGCFLVRPSSSSEPLTLTLWFGERAYNIVIRKREDEKIGLGTQKKNEIVFDTVEELVSYYQSKELILYSNGQITGRTKLGGPPGSPV